MAALGDRGRADDAVIGTVFAWILGIGVLLLSLLSTSSAGGAGISAANALFGSIYSLSAGASRLAAAIALAVTVVVAIAARRCCSPRSTRCGGGARRAGAGCSGVGFLLAVAVVTAEGTQAVGALLLLGLLSAPAGAAHQLDRQPVRRASALSGLIAVAATWAGLALSYAVASLPPSSAIIAFAAAAYVIAADPWRNGGPASGAGGSRGPSRRRIL